MDIVYIAGGKDPETERMLRYSLRSIAKYGRNVGRVLVVAPQPLNFNGVEQLTVSRRYDRKAKDIMWAIENVMDFMGDEFLYSSVDHFYVRETDFNNYPYFHRGLLPVDCPNENDHYLRHLVDTRKLLTECGLGTVDFSGHCNTHFIKRLFKKYKLEVRQSYDTDYGIEASAFMANIIDYEIGVRKVYREDIKIACANTYDNIRERIKNTDCFSILPMTMRECMGDFLEMLYPDKCRYE